MKKLLSICLVLVMVFAFAACGKTGSLAASVLPADKLKTLNEIINAGFEVVGTSISENVYVQTVQNSRENQFIVVVKVLPEQEDAVNAIDFLEDGSLEKYLDVIGNNEIADVLNTADVMPDTNSLALYKGKTIREFEAEGMWMSGYSGDNGKYSFAFSSDDFEYRVELEKGTKLEDYDDLDKFDAAIQDITIQIVTCNGLSQMYVDRYLEQFYDAPEKVVPQELGEEKASLDEINQAVGSNIKAIEYAKDEKFSVIDGKIAQYICIADGTYYCVRSAADTNINLTDDDFSEYPIVDEEGYVTTSFTHTDAIDGVRFVFNNYQYAFIAYDNGEFDWDQFDRLQQKYVDSVCVYTNDFLGGLIGSFTSKDGYAMDVSPVSDDVVQVVIYTSSDGETKLWTMLAKANGSKLTYNQSKYEVYKNGESSSKDGGKGTITVKDGALVWDKHTFN